MSKAKILVLGSNGRLGQLLVQHLTKKPHLNVVAAIRDPDDPKNRPLVSQYKQLGVQIQRADITKPDSLKGIFTGVHTIVSAVIGDDKTVISGQENAIKEAVSAGVKRFVPSDFSVLYSGVRPEEHVNLAQRIHIRALLARTPLKPIHVHNGCFMDNGVLWGFLGIWNPATATITHYGDPNQLLDFTSYEDTARFTAEAIADLNFSGDLNIVGDAQTIGGLASLYTSATGRAAKVVRLGSISDLQARIAAARKEHPTNPYAWIPLMYQLVMFDGRGKITPNINKLFPHIKPKSLLEFLKENPPPTGPAKL